jgi:ribonuclease VapC
MVIDSSAIIAILTDEQEAVDFAQSIENDPLRLMSAASWLETAIVIDAKFGLPGGEEFDKLIEVAQIHIETVTAEQVAVARAAYRKYGKGRGHPAGLNFGDCFSYALAKITGEPLLFKGEDFIYTDVLAA